MGGLPGIAPHDQENVMSLSMRRFALTATATTLGIGGVLLPGMSAMAATTPDQGTVAAAPVSQSTTTTSGVPSVQPSGCGWWSDGWIYNCW
jgi:hypothetical protein